MKINQPFQVFVRIRNYQTQNPIEIVDDKTLKISNRNLVFQKIFTENDDNTTVYQGTIGLNLGMIYQGYNMTALCYGMTGSGKTHTMFGSVQGQQGIVYQAVKELFHSKKNGYIKLSFYEIYNEQIIDLLDYNNQNLQIKEDKNGDIKIPGLSEQCIVDEDHLMTLLQIAQQRRQLASTASNLHSSRSHAIVQIQVINYDNQNQIKYKGKLILADLAGSERCYNYKQGSQQKLQHEGQNINKSLLALGQCIMMLNQYKSHIPYRNSKLTRILKQSLGGNSITLFIACVNKQASEETENTLKYAQQACFIKSQITQTFKVLPPQPKRSLSIEIKNIEEKIQKFLQINSKLHKNLNKLYTIGVQEKETKVIVSNVEQQIVSNMKQQKIMIGQMRNLIVEKENQDKSFTYRGSEVRLCDISNKQSIVSQINPQTVDQSCQTDRVNYQEEDQSLVIEKKHNRTSSQKLITPLDIHKIPQSKRFSNPFLTTTRVHDESSNSILLDKSNFYNINYFRR